MARNLFGGSSDDYAVDSTGRPIAVRRVRFYTSAAMTTEITDLASDAAGTGAPLTVNTDAHGFWGPVYSPDGVTTMYAGTVDSGGNPPAYVVAIYTHTSGGVVSFNTRAGAVSLTKADVTATALAAADVGAQNVVVHGSTAGTVRPAGATVVHWIGSVAPTNAATNDEWTDTTNKLLKRWNGTSFDALGSAAYAPSAPVRLLRNLPRPSMAMPVDSQIKPKITAPGGFGSYSTRRAFATGPTATINGIFTSAYAIAYGAAQMTISTQGGGSPYYPVATLTPAASNAPIYFEFITDAPAFIMDIRNSAPSTNYNIECDGELVTPLVSGGTGTLGIGLLQVDWSGVRKFRHYRVFGTNGLQMSAIQATAVDTVFAPAVSGVKAAFVSHSWALGYINIAHVASKMLGWKYPILDALGGTGWIGNPGGLAGMPNTGTTIPTRVAYLLPSKPDVWVFSLGTNDSGGNAAAITAQVQTTIATILADNPTAQIVFLEALSNNTTDAAGKTGVIAAIQAGAGSWPFVDPTGWFFGTGSNDAPAGDGNADLYIASSHPQGDAHPYIGARFAQALLPYYVF